MSSFFTRRIKRCCSCILLQSGHENILSGGTFNRKGLLHKLNYRVFSFCIIKKVKPSEYIKKNRSSNCKGLSATLSKIIKVCIRVAYKIRHHTKYFLLSVFLHEEVPILFLTFIKKQIVFLFRILSVFGFFLLYSYFKQVSASMFLIKLFLSKERSVYVGQRGYKRLKSRRKTLHERAVTTLHGIQLKGQSLVQ